MLFNSKSFAVFFAVVFASYWLLRRSYRAQNLLLLVASYFFYGCWDARFLVLIVLSTVVDYYCALSIETGTMSGRQRLGASALLALSTVLFIVRPYRAMQFALSGWYPDIGINWSYFSSVRSQYWWMVLALLLATVVINVVYTCLQMLKVERRKFFLIFSISANLLILGIFKYYNFFADSFSALTQSLFHITPRTSVLKVILPVGISFYTFQTMSYTIDVYRRRATASL
jgi:D-alanyl-lipoteichoic acid acyltransferase DltB (MBOAT superfamily)